MRGARARRHGSREPATVMRATEVEVAVVGAGPAGLAAALAARRLGARVLVIDEYALPGGQYHRQPAFASADGNVDSAQVRAGRALIAEVVQAGVEIWRAATVWAAYADGTLAIDRGGASVEVRAKRLVIASGAHDRVMPFPGWTIPGVITVGAAQAMCKAHALLPGLRVVMAGSGPFLLVVALDLARAGAKIELIEAASPNGAAFREFLRFPKRWGELASLLAALAARGVRIRLGRAVTSAEGHLAVTTAVSHRIDGDGAPIAGTARRHMTDALAVANGFRAQTEIARLLGCTTRYDEAVGGHVVVVDHLTGRTSVEGVYAAGEITGVAGHQVASAEGTIAGISAASSLGHVLAGNTRVLADARRRRNDAQAFADLVARTFAPRPGLTSVTTPETIVCRCEAIPRSAIEAAIDSGAHTTSAVKRWTRCGMGACQGRMCGWPLARIIAQRLARPLSEVDNLAARLPLKPVTLGNIVRSREMTTL